MSKYQVINKQDGIRPTDGRAEGREPRRAEAPRGQLQSHVADFEICLKMSCNLFTVKSKVGYQFQMCWR